MTHDDVGIISLVESQVRHGRIVCYNLLDVIYSVTSPQAPMICIRQHEGLELGIGREDILGYGLDEVIDA